MNSFKFFSFSFFFFFFTKMRAFYKLAESCFFNLTVQVGDCSIIRTYRAASFFLFFFQLFNSFIAVNLHDIKITHF